MGQLQEIAIQLDDVVEGPTLGFYKRQAASEWPGQARQRPGLKRADSLALPPPKHAQAQTELLGLLSRIGSRFLSRFAGQKWLR